MIGPMLRQPFKLHYPYSNAIERQKAQNLLVTLWILFVITLLAQIGVIAVNLATVSPFTAPQFISTGFALVVAFLYGLLQTGRLEVASTIAVGFLLASAAIGTNLNPLNYTTILYATPLVAAGLLLRWRGILATLALIVVLIVQDSVTLSAQADLDANLLAILVTLFTTLGTITGLMILFNGSQERLTRLSLAESARLEEAATFVTRISDAEDEAAVLKQAISNLRQGSDYAFVQVYRVNDEGRITQRFASGVGQRVTISDDVAGRDIGAIAEATRDRKTIFIQPGDSDIRRRHLLTGIVHAAAVPMIYHDQVLGVLDIQSEQPTSFSAIQVRSLELIASQLAGVMARIRRLKTLTENLQEQQLLIARQQERLQRIEQNPQSLLANVRPAPLTFQGREAQGFNFDTQAGALIPAQDISEAMRAAFQREDVYIERHEDRQEVSVPILLRGQIIGAMAFTVPPQTPITGRHTEMMRSVVQRLALALENKRLFEQSQAQAQRESKANEITKLLLTSTDVRTVLSLAAENFRESVGAVQTRIVLQPDNPDAPEDDPVSEARS